MVFLAYLEVDKADGALPDCVVSEIDFVVKATHVYAARISVFVPYFQPHVNYRSVFYSLPILVLGGQRLSISW